MSTKHKATKTRRVNAEKPKRRKAETLLVSREGAGEFRRVGTLLRQGDIQRVCEWLFIVKKLLHFLVSARAHRDRILPENIVWANGLSDKGPSGMRVRTSLWLCRFHVVDGRGPDSTSMSPKEPRIADRPSHQCVTHSIAVTDSSRGARPAWSPAPNLNAQHSSSTAELTPWFKVE